MTEYVSLTPTQRAEINSILMNMDFTADANDTDDILAKQLAFSDNFVKVLISSYIKTANDAQALQDVITKYEVIKADEIVNDKYYSQISSLSDVCVLVLKQPRESINIGDLTEVYNVIRSAIMINKIDNIDYAGIADVLEYYNAENIFTYNMKKFTSLSDSEKVTVLKKIKTSHGYTPIETANNLNTFIDALSVSNNDGGSRGGNGGVSMPKIELPYIPKEKTKENNSANVQFSDVSDGHWAYESIIGLANNGIVNGKGNNQFVPNDLVTREEFVKMVVAALELELVNSAGIFDDVDSGAWYSQYVNTAYYAGLVKGIDDSNFGVGDKITRQDAAVIISRAFNITGDNNLSFEDEADVSDYAYKAVAALSEKGIINGYSDGKFYPKNNATRAEIAKVLWSAINAVKG